MCSCSFVRLPFRRKQRESFGEICARALYYSAQRVTCTHRVTLQNIVRLCVCVLKVRESRRRRPSQNGCVICWEFVCGWSEREERVQSCRSKQTRAHAARKLAREKEVCVAQRRVQKQTKTQEADKNATSVRRSSTLRLSDFRCFRSSRHNTSAARTAR